MKTVGGCLNYHEYDQSEHKGNKLRGSLVINYTKK